MWKIEIKLDEQKIKRELEYHLTDMYRAIDGAYAKIGFKKQEINGGRVYTGDNITSDFCSMWQVNLALEKIDWFRDNVLSWQWYSNDNSDDGKFEVEDIKTSWVV
jgi:virulence-associated protein VapD